MNHDTLARLLDFAHGDSDTITSDDVLALLDHHEAVLEECAERGDEAGAVSAQWSWEDDAWVRANPSARVARHRGLGWFVSCQPADRKAAEAAGAINQYGFVQEIGYSWRDNMRACDEVLAKYAGGGQ